MFKNLTKKRLTLLLVSLSLILTAGVGVTLALIIDSSGPVDNTFEPSRVSCAVVEDVNYDDEASKADETVIEDNDTVEYVEVKSNVQIKNTGDTDAYIRAAIIVNWKDANGNVWAQAPVEGENNDYTMTIGSDWTLVGGYYYYKEAVAPDDFTTNLITKAESLKTLKTDDGNTYYLSIEIVASAIQSEPASVAEEAWGVDFSNLTGSN